MSSRSTPVAAMRTLSMVIAALSIASCACTRSKTAQGDIEDAVLEVLSTIRWDDEICTDLPCAVVIVDTVVHDSPTIAFQPATAGFAFSLDPTRLSMISSEKRSFSLGSRWRPREVYGDTVFASVAMVDEQSTEENSQLIVVLVVPPPYDAPSWVYCTATWTGTAWTVQQNGIW